MHRGHGFKLSPELIEAEVYHNFFMYSLKKCWKLLKQILQEYMELKKADTHRQYMKSSLKEGFESKSHQQSRDNSNSFKTWN